MKNALNAADRFPDYFESGDMWHCGDDLYLIQHPVCIPKLAHIQNEWNGFVVVTHGEMDIRLDGTPIKLLAGMSVSVLNKHDVIIEKCSDDADGIVCAMSKKMSDLTLLSKGFAIYSGIVKRPVIVHSDYTIKLLHDTMEMLKDILTNPYAENLLNVCVSLLNIYFRLVTPERLQRSYEDDQPADRYSQLMNRFTELLEKFYKSEREVQFYADQLCVTPKYLSAATKSATGHTANWWINSYVLREATQMLLNCNETVKTVASQLGFADQMLFGKYFRRQMGMSPSEYKKRELKRLSTLAQ